MNSTTPNALNRHILKIRNVRVILDADLAQLYGVPTFRFNEAVKRNSGKFPRDFRFQLNEDEAARLISQIAISKTGRGGRRNRPWAFTEHGSLMAATVLNSPRAVQMSLFVIRAFVLMREDFASNAAILRRLAEVDKTLLEHDASLQILWRRLQPLLAPSPGKPKRRIGFPICDR